MDGGYTREQELLRKLRDERCAGNAAELARRLKIDATYVNRLFYPVGKKGRKGIGLEVMRKASEAFGLPPGYWEGSDVPEPPKGDLFNAPTEKNLELLRQFLLLPDGDQEELAAEIHRRAEKTRAYRERVLREIGATPPEIRAANAARLVVATASVKVTDRLRQRSLFDDSKG